MNLIKPPKLKQGDKVAAISLSWGCAGDSDFRWRYDLGVSRLKSEFGLTAVATPHSLMGEDYIRNHPEAIAEDFMTAFTDSSIKGIIANIGGNDSLRLLPYIDFDVIRNNPKVFIGYSDILSCHLMCLKAGLSTFYGANLLTTIADPQGLHPFSRYWFQKTLFDTQSIGTIAPPDDFTCDETQYSNPNQVKHYHASAGYECLQGSGKVTGRLYGGHTMDGIGQTQFFEETFEKKEDVILFIEDIIECVSPDTFADFFRWLYRQGLMQNVKGLVVGRFNEYPENPDYKITLLQVMKELELSHLPILYNLPFGHTSPICAIPYGAMAEVDCDSRSFSVLESGVV